MTGHDAEKTFAYEFTLVMTSSTKIARLTPMDCHSDSASSFERKDGSGRVGAELTSLDRSSGRKSGAVRRISFELLSWPTKDLYQTVVVSSTGADVLNRADKAAY